MIPSFVLDRLRFTLLVAALVLFQAGCRTKDSLRAEEPAVAGGAADGTADALPEAAIADTVPDTVDEGPSDPEDDMVRTGWEMTGPEKKLGTLCKGCKILEKLPAKGPYKTVAILTDEWDSPAPGKMMNTGFHLAIRTSDGWFIHPHLGTDGMLCGGDHLFDVGFNVETFEMRDIVPGDPPEVYLTFEDSAHGIRDKKLLVCSIGPSGKPSCVGPFTPARNHPGGYSESWESSAVFLKDGSLELRYDGGARGPFILSFP